MVSKNGIVNIMCEKSNKILKKTATIGTFYRILLVNLLLNRVVDFSSS